MRRDTVVGVFAVTLGAAYSAMTWNLPRATVGNPIAPLIFPAIIGFFMIVLGAWVLVLDRGRAASASASSKPSAKDPGWWKLVVGALFLSALYGFAFETLGYVLSTWAFLTALLTLVNEPKRWRTNLLVSTVFTATLWFVFVKAFQINLPSVTRGGFF